jgi:DNA-binding beta-propeller fold protein YncE
VKAVGSGRGNTVLIAGSLTPGFVNGIGSAARFNAPTGLAMSSDGAYLYVADRDNHAIRRIKLSNKSVTTVAGKGVSGYRDAAYADAMFSLPEWILFGPDSNLYVSEVGGQRIRVLDQTLQVTKLVSGSGVAGYQNGNQKTARFQNPRGMAMIGTDFYVADNFNDQVRRVKVSGTAPFTDPAPTLTSVQPAKLSKASYGDTVAVSVTGSNFQYGAKAWFGPYQATQVYVNSSTSLTVVIPISQMPEGYYEVKVKNLDTQSAKRLRAFVVAYPDGTAPVTDYFTP